MKLLILAPIMLSLISACGGSSSRAIESPSEGTVSITPTPTSPNPFEPVTDVPPAENIPQQPESPSDATPPVTQNPEPSQPEPQPEQAPASPVLPSNPPSTTPDAPVTPDVQPTPEVDPIPTEETPVENVPDIEPEPVSTTFEEYSEILNILPTGNYQTWACNGRLLVFDLDNTGEGLIEELDATYVGPEEDRPLVVVEFNFSWEVLYDGNSVTLHTEGGSQGFTFYDLKEITDYSDQPENVTYAFTANTPWDGTFTCQKFY